jgi:putative tricarboxylic transport membrane protein
VERVGTTATPVSAPPWARACLAVSGSVLIYALLIERAGLLPAVVATVFVAALGSHPPRPLQTLIFAVGLAAAVALIFVAMLGQSIDLIVGL